MTRSASHLIRTILKYAVPTLWVAGFLVIALHWTAVSGQTLTASLGSALVAIGGLAGITGAYLALTQLLLQSRLPILEAPFGRAALVRFHRANGYAVIYVLLTHATLVLVGYALENMVSLLAQEKTFLSSFPYVLWSSIALALLIAVVVTSITIVRRKLKYESWYFVHLITYIAILLAFKHQLAVGVEFIGAGAQAWRDYWWTLYIFTFASVVIFRFGRPTYRLLRHNFKVDRVVTESPNVHSIYITGRGMDKVSYVPGQFMIWRFLDKTHFWQAHPFTISQASNGKELRLTFKTVGDFTTTLPMVKPGTPVLIDGPYGDFTLQDELSTKLLFVAGGIGLTPLRSMIETMAAGSNAVLVYAARTAADIVLKTELDELATIKHLKLVIILSDETVPGFEHGFFDDAALKRLVPDYKTRAAYICGPPPMMNGVSLMLEAAGVPAEAIHSERFAF